MTMRLRRLDASSIDSLDLEALEELLRYGAPNVVDLDKAWDGIAWLISEERRDKPYMLPDPSLPSTQAIYGVDPEKGAGGIVFRNPPARVKRIAAALESLDEAQLRPFVQPARMLAEKVYPPLWNEGDHVFGFLLGHFEAHREVYRQAAKAGDGVVTTVG